MRIRAVIFDWAGTVVDYGCRAPAMVLSRVFENRGVPLAPAECRHAMGLLKVDQIRAILELDRVKRAWTEAIGHQPDETDVQSLFAEFVPLQMDCIEEYSDVIPRVPDLVEKLRSHGIRIGSTTGYTRPMIDRLVPAAKRQGFSPDCIVTPDETGAGRPYPWMIFENMKQLGVYPPRRCVKIGDTPPDMYEGQNAGVICVGVCDSSSEADLTGADEARRLLTAAGADRVVATAPDLWDVLEEL